MEGPSYGSLAGDASRRVHSIIAAAESEAALLRREAEREAERLRREAEDEAARIVDQARAYADDAVRERLRRIGELSDAAVERTEMLLDRMSGAAQVKGQLESLMRALGDAAEAVAREVAGSAVQPAPEARPREPDRSRPPEPPREAQRSPEPEAPSPAEPPPADEAPADEPLPPAPADEAGARPEPPEGADQRPARLVAQGKPPAPRRGRGKVESQFDGARLVALQMAVAGSTREEVAAELERTFDLPDSSPILDDVFGTAGPRRASPAGR